MRDVLIHDRDDVNLDIIWKTATEDLPPLTGRLEAHLKAHPPPGADDPSNDV